MGYDQPKSLGGREFGGTLALPIWADYMRDALRSKPEIQKPAPAGLVQVDGDWMYNEYENGDAVRTLDVQTPKSLWERLFGTQPPVLIPAPAPAPPPTQDEKEKQRVKELYIG
jgi:penicillin-binding protein 1A